MQIFFTKHNTNIDIYICMIIYLYEHTHTHPIFMSTFERLSRLDLEIYEVGHQVTLTCVHTTKSRKNSPLVYLIKKKTYSYKPIKSLNHDISSLTGRL
jgi:hypothetical protein